MILPPKLPHSKSDDLGEWYIAMLPAVGVIVVAFLAFGIVWLLVS